jgi:hypothetical protein
MIVRKGLCALLRAMKRKLRIPPQFSWVTTERFTVSGNSYARIVPVEDTYTSYPPEVWCDGISCEKCFVRFKCLTTKDDVIEVSKEEMPTKFYLIRDYKTLTVDLVNQD